MFSEKLTRPSTQWLVVALVIGLAAAIALSMTFAGAAEAKKKKRQPAPPPTPTCQTFPTGQLCALKTASATKVVKGKPLTFTVTETSFLNFNTNDFIIDNLPPGVQFVSATQSPGGACTNNAGTVTCPPAPLPIGGKITATIVVNTTQTGTFTNSAHSFNNITSSATFKVFKKKRHHR